MPLRFFQREATDAVGEIDRALAQHRDGALRFHHAAYRMRSGPAEGGNARDARDARRVHRCVDRVRERAGRPRRADLGFGDGGVCGIPRDDRDIRDIGAVDEKRSRDRVMEGSRRRVPGTRANEFPHLEREPRIDVATDRLDRQPDLACDGAQAFFDRGPLLVAKGLGCALERRLGMQFERQPPRGDAEFARRLLDPDRAEIAEGSNDVGPD